MEEPEQKWPAISFTPWRTMSLATATACFGSQASSPTASFSFWPSTPPAALISATACSAPAFIWAPKLAYCPVIGPAVATVMSAFATCPVKTSAAAARTSVDSFFILISLLIYSVERDQPSRAVKRHVNHTLRLVAEAGNGFPPPASAARHPSLRARQPNRPARSYNQ